MPIATKTDRFAESAIDGELLLMHAEAGTFNGLKGTGLAIWRLLDEDGDLDRVKARLAEQYAVDGATCNAEVDAFVAELEQAGFVTVT